MSETQSGTNGDAQTDDQLSTWGDVRDTLPAVDLPSGVDESDSIGEKQLNEWLRGVVGQIDADDFENLRALPDDVTASERLRLIGNYAARGDGDGAPRTDGGEQRENARPSWGGGYGGVPDRWANTERSNASVEDVPSGGDPFGSEDAEAEADRSAMQTDGPIRANAGSKEDTEEVSIGGLSGPNSRTKSRVNATDTGERISMTESAEEKWERVSSTAQEVFKKLEADGPEAEVNLRTGSTRYNAREIGEAVADLEHIGLIERVNSTDPREFRPVEKIHENNLASGF